MSGTEFDPPEDDLDVLAGEYALGLLDGAGLARVAQLRQRDGRFDAALREWEARLMPLAEALTPVSPRPEVWEGIAAAIAGPAAARPSTRLWESMRFWRALSLSVAVMGAAMVVAVWRLDDLPRRQAVATLSVAGGGAFVASAQVQSGGLELVVSPANVAVPAGKSDELWVILPGQAPRAVGLLAQAEPVRLNAGQLAGALEAVTLAVSVEPLGGSPTGKPTGPVVAEAKFTPL